MGGSKKKSPAQQEKSQDGKKSTDKKGKKGEKGESSSGKAEITVSLTEEQAMKAVKSAKAITVQEIARQTGVKISAANAFLKSAVEKGTVKKIGGHSGHYIYQSA